MKVLRTPLEGVFVLEGTLVADDRGHFARTFDEDVLHEKGLTTRFPQHSLSYNRTAGTLRGMHYQAAPHGEVKVVRCTRGAVFDVAVDVRPGSPSYGQWHGVELKAGDPCSLYVPMGCAHGFVTLSDETELTYLISTAYRPAAARGIRWDDPDLAISWPVVPTVISQRDLDLPLLSP